MYPQKKNITGYFQHLQQTICSTLEKVDGRAHFIADKWIDLTPHYINKPDTKYFHSTLKKICDRFHHSYYLDFKKNAEEYFFLPHRGETRGIGGIFFDHLAEDEYFSLSDRFEFIKAVGNSFIPFYDRGTKFGLLTGGRTESILMSLPPHAEWRYDFSPEKGTKEYQTLQLLRNGCIVNTP